VSQVLENLVGARPLPGRDDDVDVAASTTVQGVVGDARRVHPERPQLVTPGHGGRLILKRADRLPAVKARIADRHRWIFGSTSSETKASHRQEGNEQRERACPARLSAYGAPELWMETEHLGRTAVVIGAASN
jgi:hypothetical protein